MENINSVSDILYVKRVTKRMTQTELAKRAGCSVSMICTIEAGKRIPSVEMIVKIAKALEMDQDDLYICAAEDLRNDIKKLWNKT